jgi:hypothetical protein
LADSSDCENGTAPQSRRKFLKRSLALAVAAAVPDLCRAMTQQVPPGGPELLSHGAPAKSLVVKAGPERLSPHGVVAPAFIGDALAEGLCRLTGETNVRDAWRRILRPDDTILLKFNRSGASTLGTTGLVAPVLVRSLAAAGWGYEQIILLEVEDVLPEVKRTGRPDLRWQDAVVDFGASGRDSFLAALDQATALINVAFLKTHHLATISGCLKNLSHGLIRHPARFHAHGCDPAIAEIVASDPIRTKLKLNVVNAIRVIYDRGPAAAEDNIHGAATLLLGRDPVACDAVGCDLLNEVRSLHKRAPLVPEARRPRSLVSAARLGVGNADAERIEVQDV